MENFLSPTQYWQVQVCQKIEYLQIQIVKVLGCSFADVQGSFYTDIYKKATGIIEFSNTTLVFVMLEDAEELAQEGLSLSAIKQKILDHKYIRNNPIDVLTGNPFPRKILWTIRNDQEAKRRLQVKKSEENSLSKILAAIEGFNKELQING